MTPDFISHVYTMYRCSYACSSSGIIIHLLFTSQPPLSSQTVLNDRHSLLVFSWIPVLSAYLMCLLRAGYVASLACGLSLRHAVRCGYCHIACRTAIFIYDWLRARARRGFQAAPKKTRRVFDDYDDDGSTSIRSMCLYYISHLVTVETRGGKANCGRNIQCARVRGVPLLIK